MTNCDSVRRMGHRTSHWTIAKQRFLNTPRNVAKDELILMDNRSALQVPSPLTSRGNSTK